MRRTIFLTLAFALSSAAFAQTLPAIYPNVPFNRLSPDGKLVMSETSIVMDFSTGKQYSYVEKYSGGSGNCISSTGVIVGYQMETEKAAYWKGGSWTLLPSTPQLLMSYANGITPDGTRIVGAVSMSAYSGDYEGQMLVPCYWDVNADGTISDHHVLPYPNKDYTGRPPQYVTAVRVSDDGKTIAGQVRDFSGFVCQPLIYRQDANGDWTYEMLLDELYYPAGFQLPEDPGEALSQEDFMTPEEVEKYEQDVNLWNILGGDISTYPDIYDYMTQEEIDAFTEYFLEWSIESEEYYSKLSELYALVPNLSYNNVFMNSDASLYVSTDVKGFYDEYTGISIKNYTIYVIDLITGNYTAIPPKDDIHLTASALADNGTIFAQSHNLEYNIFNGYILPAGETEFIPLYDYVKSTDPKIGDWMKDNMTHDYMAIDLDDFSTYTATTLATGVPYCTPDMSLIAASIANFWDYEISYTTFGYLYSVESLAGVETISTEENIGLTPLSDGRLAIKGEPSTLEIYALNGLKVFSHKSPSGIIETVLPNGLYVARLTDKAGKNINKKIIIK
ncbi:MAG: T9SS type A sorting domain-containing protein [Muribaculaceae bacterium]|nr:T9SS type A sorting domain-containing protein [Muribaculaceae bacterium]